MDQTTHIQIGAQSESKEAVTLNLKYANRHGLVAGATGTGKTVTLQILAEQFSKAGVPVFLADVKGDLSGMGQPGAKQDFLVKRASDIQLKEYPAEARPVIFWDLYGKKGHPVRTTVTEMGALLMARLLDLNETQEGILHIAFKLAKDEEMALLDLKDLRALVISMSERASELGAEYGHISKASLGAIQRKLIAMEQEKVGNFFGEPALDLSDMMRTHINGQGMVNILNAQELIQSPRLYATFLMWLLAELFEELPEVGDPDKPRLVFFFDEAHLLFKNAPKALLEKVEQVVRLIRSKGVGVYFITQSPDDVPEAVLGQLGNKIQHALRAFTPKARKAVSSAAKSFRPNPDLDTQEVIMTMGVGEALVSTLESKGTPSIVQQTLIRPPESLLGPAPQGQVAAQVKASPIYGRYDNEVDRESAYEILKKRAADKAVRQAEMAQQAAKDKPKKRSSGRQSYAEAAIKTVIRSLSTRLAGELFKTVLKSIKK